MDNILKPACQSKAGKVLFYIFEIAALVVAAIYILLGLINAIEWSNFMTFVNGLVEGAIQMLVLYGIGRVIDLLYKLAEK